MSGIEGSIMPPKNGLDKWRLPRAASHDGEGPNA
jgi:CRP/FNR family transcriptional regulator, cyclic AMP receptor protein